MFLEARLHIENLYKRHPKIEDEEIRQPIMVVGQGRSGTSFLMNILAANPDYGSPQYWEVMFPDPPPEKATYRSDPRIDKGHKLIDQWNRVTPNLPSLHEFSGAVPQECCLIMALNFVSPSWFDALGQVASYDAWVMKHNLELTVRYHQRVLKLLQWKTPRTHWVLKDVMYIDRLALMLKVYPDACFVWPHRDPVRALASVIDLIGTMQWARSDHPFKGGSYEYVTDASYSAARLNAVIDQLESNGIPERQIFHLQYSDLIRDTLGTLDAMHQHFGIALSETGRGGMAKYLADHPRDARPPHRFSIGSDEMVAHARKAYKRYQDYFRIPSE